MNMTHAEIYEAYLTEKAAREKAGFDMPGARAIEDTAYMLDLSIKEVCVAISVCEKEAGK
jgi:hypothetical protein